MRRKRSILSGVLILTLSIGVCMNTNATTIEDAEKKAEELEQQKSAAEAEQASLTTQPMISLPI